MNMPESVAKRRNFIINFVFLVLVTGLVYAFFKYAFWFVSPFLIAFLIAMMLQKPLREIDRKTKINHTFSSIFLVVFLVVIILVPLGLILGKLIAELIDFLKYVINSFEDLPAMLTNIQNGILKMLKFLPESIYDNFSVSIIETFNSLKEDFDISKLGISFETFKEPISGVVSAAKNVPGAILGSVIGFIACIFMTKDYRPIANFINAQMPDGKKNLLPEIKNVFFTTIGKMFRAYGLIMLITFSEIFISLNLLKWFKVFDSGYIFAISVGIAIFDILPVLGAGGVLIPWALYMLIIGNIKMGIAIIAIYLFILGFRQYLEPKIVGGQLGVHPIITLAGLYFGLKLFGFIGMFVVPICIMTLKALNDSGRIKIWKSDIHVEQKEHKFRNPFKKKKQ